MKKLFWYILLPAGIIIALFRGVPYVVDWAKDRENARMRANQDYAEKRAREITQPAVDAAGSEPSLYDSIDSYTPPKVEVRGRTQEIMDNRGEQLDEAGEWE